MIEEEAALALLKAAYDRGLNTWDTANVYSNGVSEEIIGKAIKHHNIPRDKLVILTKCYGFVGETPGVRGILYGKKMNQSKDYVNRGGLSRTAIFKAVNASLKRLGTDYIDLLQIHRYDPDTPVEETMEALHDLVKSGKVHYIGASSMWAYQVSFRPLFRDLSYPQKLMPPFSLPACNLSLRRTAGQSLLVCRTTIIFSTERKSER